MSEEASGLQTTGGWTSVLEKYHRCLPSTYTVFSSYRIASIRDRTLYLENIRSALPRPSSCPKTHSQPPSPTAQETAHPFCSFGEKTRDFRQQQDVPRSTGWDWSLTGMDAGSSEGQARGRLCKAALEPWHSRQGHRSFSPRFGEGQESTSESRAEQLAN